MRILVTGASGFIGRHTVDSLREGGHNVITLSRQPEPPFPELAHHSCALESEAPLDAVDDVDGIIHLAGLADASSSWRDPIGYARVNAQGTLHLLEAARTVGAVFVLVSSQRVYQPTSSPLTEDAPTDPPDPYGYSKLVAERWVELYHRHYGLATTVVRPFSVYGPGQIAKAGTSGVVAIFMREALAGHPLRVFGDQVRDFVYVSDVARGLRLAIERLVGDRSGITNGRTFNLATGQATSLWVLAEAVRNALGVDVPIEEHSLDRPGERYVADVRRIAADLGFEAEVSLDEGLRRFARWYCEQRETAV